MKIITRLVRSKHSPSSYDKITFGIETVSPSEASMMADHGKFDIELSRGYHDKKPPHRPYGILPHIKILDAVENFRNDDD